MKLLISTPCSGGNLKDRYVASLLTCISTGISEGLFTKIQPHFQGKESLIHRGRNRAAMYAYENGFDKIITIDADISFTYEDFKRIVTSDEMIVGGSYPIKSFPVVVNFNPLEGKGTEFFSTNRGIDYDAFEKFKAKYADPKTGLAEVRHLPTGFLCVRREVFEKLGETSEIYEDFDSSSGERKRFMHFYPSDVKDFTLRSEDWAFCDNARAAGFKIMFDTRVVTGHVGDHEYRLGQFFGQIQT
jgi:hypothetical protein